MLKKQHCLFFSNCVNLPCKIEKFELEVVGVVILETGVYFQKETKKKTITVTMLYITGPEILSII